MIRLITDNGPILREKPRPKPTKPEAKPNAKPNAVTVKPTVAAITRAVSELQRTQPVVLFVVADLVGRLLTDARAGTTEDDDDEDEDDPGA